MGRYYCVLCSSWKPSTELPSCWISSLDLELSSPPSSLTPHTVLSIVQFSPRGVLPDGEAQLE